MKRTELMVGDIVMFKPQHYPTKIKVINNTCCMPFEDIKVSGWVKYGGLEDVEPIPLTEEILEKNGWKEAEFWHEYKDENNTIQACLPDMRGILNGIEIQHFNCKYVHQYQHLLRLCGLNEMANNFKI